MRLLFNLTEIFHQQHDDRWSYPHAVTMNKTLLLNDNKTEKVKDRYPRSGKKLFTLCHDSAPIRLSTKTTTWFFSDFNRKICPKIIHSAGIFSVPVICHGITGKGTGGGADMLFTLSPGSSVRLTILPGRPFRRLRRRKSRGPALCTRLPIESGKYRPWR